MPAAPSDHRESIRAKLTSYLGMTARDIGDVLYLATLIRDTTFVSPIVNMITDTSYSGGACVYSCPCVFALVTFTAFSEADSLPPMDKSITAVSDHYSDLRYVRTMSLEQGVSRLEYADDAKNKQITEMLALSEAELVSRAEASLGDYTNCFMAVHALELTVHTSAHLTDLYWLAVMEFENDASFEFRSSLYRAIWRAEKARMNGN